MISDEFSDIYPLWVYIRKTIKLSLLRVEECLNIEHPILQLAHLYNIINNGVYAFLVG